MSGTPDDTDVDNARLIAGRTVRLSLPQRLH
jgi:hypothetical protein